MFLLVKDGIRQLRASSLIKVPYQQIGMELPLIKIVLSLITISVLVLGCLVNLLEPYMPIFISKALRYGKFAYKGPADKSRIPSIEVPKR